MDLFWRNDVEKIKGSALSEKISCNRLFSDFYYEFPEDFNYSGDSHAGWEFVYIESGKVSVRADDETFILKKGEMVCHKPFQFHSIRPFESKTAITLFCFEVDGKYNEYMEYFNNKILTVNQRQKQYLSDIVEMGRTVFLPKDPLETARDGQMDISPYATELDLQFIKNSIELLIISLLSSDATEKKSRISLYKHISQRQTLTESIVEYLKSNIEKNVDLAGISKQFSYSLSSIKRIFKEETGESIIAYLNGLRMQKAKELLDDKELPIGEIAHRVGFANTYYFSNAFKKHWGESPSKYREKT